MHWEQDNKVLKSQINDLTSEIKNACKEWIIFCGTKVKCKICLQTVGNCFVKWQELPFLKYTSVMNSLITPSASLSPCYKILIWTTKMAQARLLDMTKHGSTYFLALSWWKRAYLVAHILHNLIFIDCSKSFQCDCSWKSVIKTGRFCDSFIASSVSFSNSFVMLTCWLTRQRYPSWFGDLDSREEEMQKAMCSASESNT